VAVRRGAASLRGNVKARGAEPGPPAEPIAGGFGATGVDVATALRTSREALSDIEGQLDALLAALRDPAAALDKRAPDRLRGATQDAGTALASLTAALAAF
jgi:hypothetical protein